MLLIRKLNISYSPCRLENCLRICGTADELTQIRLAEEEKQATSHHALEYGALKSLLCICRSDCLCGADCMAGI